ncbi:hypothetical protein P4U44_04490 [Alkalihalobacillus alcalophilus]|nr:hypothetical protein [Alkalihalobacillus alcalophilus]MED1561175.1 hypothetical protein [Alkalihalobacillus alcalophilus]
MESELTYGILIGVAVLIAFSFLLGIWTEGGDTTEPNPLFSFNV